MKESWTVIVLVRGPIYALVLFSAWGFGASNRDLWEYIKDIDSTLAALITGLVAIGIFANQRRNELEDKRIATQNTSKARVMFTMRRVAFAIKHYMDDDTLTLMDLQSVDRRLKIPPAEIYHWSNRAIEGCAKAIPILLDSIDSLTQIHLNPDIDTEFAKRIFWAREELFECSLMAEEIATLDEQPNYDFFGTWRNREDQLKALKIGDKIAQTINKANGASEKIWRVFQELEEAKRP